MAQINKLNQSKIMQRKIIDNDKMTSFLSGSLGFSACGILIHNAIAKKCTFFKTKIFHEGIVYLANILYNSEIIITAHQCKYFYTENNKSYMYNYSYKYASDLLSSFFSIKNLFIKNEAQEKIWRNTYNILLNLASTWLKNSGYSNDDIIKRLYPIVTKHFPNENNSKFLYVIFQAQPSIPYLISNHWDKINDAVIFVADVDYHVRNFVMICRELQKINIPCAIIDISPFNPAKRICSQEEMANFHDVTIIQISYDQLKSLPIAQKAYVFACDWSIPFRNFIYDLIQHGTPVICYYEGISDDNNLESHERFLPYRLCDHLLLPGKFYQKYYHQNTYIVGSPTISKHMNVDPTFPSKHKAIINLNFSYGVLEDKRNTFLTQAIEACKACNIEYVISQHPADNGLISDTKISQKSIYDEIRNGSMLVSRFSTCILESLCAGKPVIYFNPHSEKFDTFKEPLDAFFIANTINELEDAIKKTCQDIENGVDFRKRADCFLDTHVNIHSNVPSAQLCAEAISTIIGNEKKHDEQQKRVFFFNSHPALADVKI